MVMGGALWSTRLRNQSSGVPNSTTAATCGAIAGGMGPGDALADKEFASITGPAGEGTLFTFGPDPRKKPTAKAIVEKFRAKNIDPEGYTLYTYAAIQVWSGAVKKAGTTDPKKVMDTIKAGSWDTVIGTLQFDAKGDIKQIDYVVYKWDASGGYAEISPKGS